MKKVFLLVIVLAVATGCRGVFDSNNKPPQPVACTQEAMLCPDGSAVGRTGPNCEFAKCPEVRAEGTIMGKVEVGPICPVEREDMPCPVPPEAFTSREVILYAADGVTEVQRMYFTPDGTYSFRVPAGEYVLNIPRQGIGGTSELPKSLSLSAGQIIEVNFSIDTGIR